MCNELEADDDEEVYENKRHEKGAGSRQNKKENLKMDEQAFPTLWDS